MERKDIVRELRKTYKSIIPETFEEPDPTQFIASGILSLDWALGGGVPRGQITHFWGQDGSGKTLTMIPLAISAQREPLINGLTLYLATEPKVDERIFYRHGVDPEKIIFAKSREKENPLDGNKVMDMLKEAVGQVDLIVLDSVAGLAPRIIYEMQSEDTVIGKVAALLAMHLPAIANYAATTKTAIVFLNQARANFDQYGMEIKPFAGYALRHWIANSGWMRSGGWIKKGNETVGFNPKITMNKNDFAPPRREADWKVIWKDGIDYVDQLVNFAKDLGVISSGGGYMKLGDTPLNHDGERGIKDAIARIREEPELQEAITSAVMEAS